MMLAFLLQPSFTDLTTGTTPLVFHNYTR